jgi:hypothetical protein
MRYHLPRDERSKKLAQGEAGDLMEFLLFGGTTGARLYDHEDNPAWLPALEFRTWGSYLYLNDQGDIIEDRIATITPELALERFLCSCYPIPRLTSDDIRNHTLNLHNCKPPQSYHSYFEQPSFEMPTLQDIPDPDANAAGRPIQNLADRKFIRARRPQDRTPKRKDCKEQQFPATYVAPKLYKTRMTCITWTAPLSFFLVAMGVALIATRSLPPEIGQGIGSVLGALVMAAFLAWPLPELPSPLAKKPSDDLDEDDGELEQRWNLKWLEKLLDVRGQDDEIPTETPEEKTLREDEALAYELMRKEEFDEIDAARNALEQQAFEEWSNKNYPEERAKELVKKVGEDYAKWLEEEKKKADAMKAEEQQAAKLAEEQKLKDVAERKKAEQEESVRKQLEEEKAKRDRLEKEKEAERKAEEERAAKIFQFAATLPIVPGSKGVYHRKPQQTNPFLGKKKPKRPIPLNLTMTSATELVEASPTNPESPIYKSLPSSPKSPYGPDGLVNLSKTANSLPTSRNPSIYKSLPSSPKSPYGPDGLVNLSKTANSLPTSRNPSIYKSLPSSPKSSTHKSLPTSPKSSQTKAEEQ